MRKRLSTLETRANLVQAFWEIYREKNIRNMSIAEVARKAGYHRGTFYRYFNSLEEILELLERETNTLEEPEPSPELFREKLLTDHGNISMRYMQRKGEYILRFVGPDGDANYVSRTIASQIPLYRAAFACPENEALLDYAVAYTVGGSLAVFRLWHDNGEIIPEKALADLYALLQNHGPMAVFEPASHPEIADEMRAIAESISK